jgi:TolB-like protein
VVPSVTEPSHAVFLSYASQDAGAAHRICEALRAADIEVFFDQSELRGGDAWDQKIRREIDDCALFIPVISANTVSRHEGYFRLEWDLADQRTHKIARSHAFVVPVCLDATNRVAADVPESFQRVQWTHLPGGETPPAFVERIKHLLSPQLPPASAVPGAAPAIRAPVRASWRSKLLPLVIIAAAALAYFFANKFWIPKLATPATAARAAPATGFNPPPHSIAVLPFVNMSGDREQEYFSEGLTEEILNSLVKVNELQVAARTSSFSFQGEHPDIATVAHKLNVASVLEGSVRRSGTTVRITAQLVNATSGFHLWSETYDRSLKDVLNLQTEIANAVATALKVSLLADTATRIELGGTRNPAALDAYLRGRQIYFQLHGDKDVPTMIAAYTKAIELDPSYALAFASRSLVHVDVAGGATGPAMHEALDKAQRDALKAIALAPELAEGHLALAEYSLAALDFRRANEEFERAFALAPGNAFVLQQYGVFSVCMGRIEAAIAAARRAVALDPLNVFRSMLLVQVLYLGRHYEEAISASQDALRLFPAVQAFYWLPGLAYYQLGDPEHARTSCERGRPDYGSNQYCLAFIYHNLDRQADAERMLAKMMATNGDAAAYQYAQIYAQWGNPTRALGWLEKALGLRDTGLAYIKTDPGMDPLRNEPRFQAVMRELKFPD